MHDVHFLKYGFVVSLNGHYFYDHVLKNVVPYTELPTHLPQLLENTKPIAKLYGTPEHGTVKSPVFRYEETSGGLECFQSAYYLVDSLTRKSILPVYFPETGEVKDLFALLPKSHQNEAKAVIQILRARYIRPASRKPSKCFMQEQSALARSDARDANDTQMIEMSDEEMLKVFGRLPVSISIHEDEPIEGDNDAFISDSVARRA